MAAEFIRGPWHAIGWSASIIYLGNYTEAGSTPVAREPQIIERHAFAVSPTTPATEQSGIVKRFLRNCFSLSLSLSLTFFLPRSWISRCSRSSATNIDGGPKIARCLDKKVCKWMEEEVKND